MCPPALVPPPADISLYWTDGEIFMSLEKIISGSPLPGNVIPDANPYQAMPSKLQDDVWYFIHSEEKKDTELGFWKARGDASDIFKNSAITGWRTTLEFYEGQAPHGRRTGWVMQQYQITQKGLCDSSKPEDSSSLCRVFLSDGQSLVHEMPPNHSGADAARNHSSSILSFVPNADSTTGQGSTSESQEKNRADATGPLTMIDRVQDPPAENLQEFDYRSSDLADCDFLELNDLIDPGSPSSSSDNSSCVTLSSDEYFDWLALLQDLGQGKDASFKNTGSATVKPNEVVVHPETLGSPIGGNGSRMSADGTVPGSPMHKEMLDKRDLEHAIGSQQANEGTSNSRNMSASPSKPKSVSERKRKAIVVRMKKMKKKYLCFMPF